jgi:hypothetical protein
MRYLVMLIALVAVFASAGYVASAFDTDKAAVNSAGPVVVVDASQYPDHITRTCSGAEPRFGAQPYFFGFTKPGLCMTRVIYANTYGEARECAAALCPDCRIEDITGWYQFSSSVRDPSGRQSFCPAK